jgi:hypothetical protein
MPDRQWPKLLGAGIHNLSRARKDKRVMLGIKAILLISTRDRQVPTIRAINATKAKKLLSLAIVITPSPLPHYHRPYANPSGCQGHGWVHRWLHQLHHSWHRCPPATSHHVTSWILKPSDASARCSGKMGDELLSKIQQILADRCRLSLQLQHWLKLHHPIPHPIQPLLQPLLLHLLQAC